MAISGNSQNADRDIGRLQAEVVSLEKRLAESEQRLETRLESIEEKVQLILDAANMGKGAWWLVLKAGAILSALIAVSSWVFEKLSHMVPGAWK